MVVFGAGEVTNGREVFVVEKNAIKLQGQVLENEAGGKELADCNLFGAIKRGEASAQQTRDQGKCRTGQEIHDGGWRCGVLRFKGTMSATKKGKLMVIVDGACSQCCVVALQGLGNSGADYHPGELTASFIRKRIVPVTTPLSFLTCDVLSRIPRGTSFFQVTLPFCGLAAEQHGHRPGLLVTSSYNGDSLSIPASTYSIRVVKAAESNTYVFVEVQLVSLDFVIGN